MKWTEAEKRKQFYSARGLVSLFSSSLKNYTYCKDRPCLVTYNAEKIHYSVNVNAEEKCQKSWTIGKIQ
jgi:hypothetical protein